MGFDSLGEIQLEVANQRVVMTDELEVGRDTFARTSVGTVVGPVLTVTVRRRSRNWVSKWTLEV